MSRARSIARVTLSRIGRDPAWLLVEVDDGRTAGLATAVDRAGLAEAVRRRAGGLIGAAADLGPGPGLDDARLDPGAGHGGGDRPRDEAERIAAGLLASARQDLAARRHRVPLWRWLGGAVRDRVEVDGGAGAWLNGPAGPRLREADGWPALVSDLLEDRIDGIVVDPLRVGGPAGVLRLDALARAFRVGLVLVGGGSPAERALVVHLAVSAAMATPPVRWPGGAPDPAWLRPSDAYHPVAGAVARPESPGLGLEVDRERLEALVAKRWTVGGDGGR